MPNTSQTISHIQVGVDIHDIDAVTLGGETISNIENAFQLIENLVTEIDSSSTDEEYVSAKCLYDMIWGSGGEHEDEPLYDYSKEYLTFDIVEGGTILWKKSSASSTITRTISYSLNDGDWIPITSTTSGACINVNSGDKLKFKGNNAAYSSASNYYNNFGGTAKFNIYGNIMSLLATDDFDDDDLDTLRASYTFHNLFYNCKVISCKKLILPATTLSSYCYSHMFNGCTLLIDVPELPATTLASSCYNNMFYYCTHLLLTPTLPATVLANSCYSGMFQGCSSLTEAPELPVTTLTSYCYSNMFSGCSSLTEAPELPATTLVNSCYSGMFIGCTSLTSAPVLPATTLASSCYAYMFKGCTGLTSAPTLPITKLESYCYDHMFYGCSGLTVAPTLPATTMEDYCYRYMFYGCSGLTVAPTLPATTLASYCYQYMFYNCTGLTITPTLPATTLTDHCYQYMFNKCKYLTTVSGLPATTLAPYCYSNMFNGCTRLTSVPSLPATTLSNYCYSNMFNGCTSLTSAPVLPATILTTYCYQSMFYGCYRLSNITCYATTNLNINNLENWVFGVSSTGTFTGISNAHWQWGVNGIPKNWNTNVNVIEIKSKQLYGMWVDDFLEVDMPLDEWVEMCDVLGSNRYNYTGNTIQYNNQTYYVWERDDDNYHESVYYALTTTVDYNTLRQKSLDYDISNITEHPVSYFFDDAMDEYATCEDQNIVYVGQYNNLLYMYVDDFVRNDVDIQDFIDDPESNGANYYEYCDEFEYDGDTYYIWMRFDNNNNVKYLLTNTINLETLQSYSLEEDISNLTTHPIIAYLNTDLHISYNNNQRFDNIIKVFEIAGYHSQETLGMYIDDFPDSVARDDGYHDVYEFLEEYYMHNPEQGGNYYEYCASFEYDGDNYYIWKLTDDGHNGVDSNLNNTIQVRYVLTNTINFQTLYQESLEHSLSNIESHTNPLICYLDEDLNETYIAEERTDHIVTVFQL